MWACEGDERDDREDRDITTVKGAKAGKMRAVTIIFVLAVSSSALQLDSRRTALSRVVGAVPAVTGSVALADSVAATASVALNSGSRFPLASFGLQVYDDSTAYKLTSVALEVGYRNFFASVLAGNQKGFAKAVKDSGVPRDQLYICGTVLSNRVSGDDAAYKKTKQGCLENMEAMSVGGIDHLDMSPNEESVRGQWRALEGMKLKDKTVGDLAVSNFSAQQLDAILSNEKSIRPTVNQLPFSVAYHPGGTQMIDYNTERNILVQSWSPLSRVLRTYGNDLEAIGKRHNKSAAQVGLRWIVQSGASFCTQSKSRSHFEEDLNVFDFALTDSEMAAISKLA